MTAMVRPALLILAILVTVVGISGCCNSHFKAKQLGDDLHTYFADGDTEALSEAEPDNGI